MEADREDGRAEMTAPGRRTHGVHHVAIQVRDLRRDGGVLRRRAQLPELRRWPGDDGERSIWFDLDDGASWRSNACPAARPHTRATGRPTSPASTGGPRHQRATSATPGRRTSTSAGVAVAHRTPTTRSTCATPKATASACRTGPTHEPVDRSAAPASARAAAERRAVVAARSRSCRSTWRRPAAWSPAGWPPARPRSASWSGSAPATGPPRRPRR